MTDIAHLLLAGAAISALSWLSVAALRWYALSRGVLDHPSHRSSHAAPTPRGGGAGAVLAAVAGFIALVPQATHDAAIILAIAGIMPTAVAGWIDDHGTLPVLPRLFAHLVSAAFVIPLAVRGLDSPMTIALVAIACMVAVVSAINVVNFLDGIDGLIGVQALLFGLHLMLLSAANATGIAFGLSLAAASLGFLIWNWPPARIFLGDVGSGSLAVLGVIGGALVWRAGQWPFLAVFLPLLPIFLDAAVTIVRRARRGERLTTAHRTHLYQRLANDARWGHARVTLLYGVAAAAGTATVLLSAGASRTAAIAAYVAVIYALGLVCERAAKPAPPTI